jgi:DNA-binding phage protein
MISCAWYYRSTIPGAVLRVLLRIALVLRNICATVTNMSSTSFHDRFLAEQLTNAEFREEFERERREIEAVDAIVGALDGLRDERGLSKAELARQIGKNPASVRRTLTAPGNPELRTIIAMADALGAEIKIVRRRRPAIRQAA